MRLIGITRIRNEADIIQNTLDHVSKLVDGIVVYDDCSTDSTASICESHPAVLSVLRGIIWDPTSAGRNRAEGTLRQEAYKEAVRMGAEYVYCFDSDEYVEFDRTMLNITKDAYYFRLFDFYITHKDINDNYLDRQYMGPEYRDIPMLFKVSEMLNFTQRIPKNHERAFFGGYVKHYGKAISVEEWNKTCKYYIEHRWTKGYPELLQRWKNRRGKAIHSASDFGRELITWEDRKNEEKIIKL